MVPVTKETEGLVLSFEKASRTSSVKTELILQTISGCYNQQDNIHILVKWVFGQQFYSFHRTDYSIKQRTQSNGIPTQNPSPTVIFYLPGSQLSLSSSEKKWFGFYMWPLFFTFKYKYSHFSRCILNFIRERVSFLKNSVYLFIF